MFGGWVKFNVKRRQVIDVLVVKIFNNSPSRGFEVFEINQQTDVIELSAANVDLNSVVMSVGILAFSVITAQSVCRRESHLDHYFSHYIKIIAYCLSLTVFARSSIKGNQCTELLSYQAMESVPKSL